MNLTSRSVTVAAVVVGLAGCTSGQSSIQPPYTSANIAQQTALQFAVGTANIGGTATGLNTVVSFRQANGLSATLLNTPSITGPTGFVVPSASSAGIDAGTSSITAAPQTPAGQPAPPVHTFGQSYGAFGYGFEPANSSTAGAANYPQYSAGIAPNNLFNVANADPLSGGGGFVNTVILPLYQSVSTRVPFIGGPPAFPFFQDGTQPPGFLGYPSGFTDFSGTTLATGSYTLSVLVPAANTNPTTLTASSTLSSTALLPAMPAPTFALNADGSATVTEAVPAGVTETLVYVVDEVNSATASPVNTFYTVLLPGGTTTGTIPGNVGNKHAASFNSGDTVYAYAVGFDYPAFEAAPPANRSEKPTISGSNGQADITVSPVVSTNT